MPNPRHLNAAPIVEAVIDIQVTTPSSLDVNAFRRLQAEFSFADRVEQIRTFSVVIGKAAWKQSESTKSSEALGLRFFSDDQKVIVQMRKNGFTFSRLTPYTKWEEIFPRASEIFKAFWKIAAPEEVKRIAVRNINRLMLPHAGFNETLAHYFASPPMFPNDPRSYPKHWMTRFVLQHVSNKMEAIVTQMAEDRTIGDQRGLIFDIDVFARDAFPLDPEAVLQRLPALREWKNTLFFEALTEAAIKEFQ